MIRRMLAVLACLLLLTGCADERVIEKIGFIRTIAFEKAEDSEQGEGDLKVTISIPKSNQKDSVLYQTVAHSSREARLVFDRQNDRRIVNGQLRQVLFGESFAEEGMWSEMDSLLRDPSIGNRVHVLVAEGDIYEMLAKTYTQGNTAGEYLDNLIRTESGASDIPDTNLYSFARDYYDDGIEPVASIVKTTPRSIIVQGIALFRGDRMVAKIAPDRKAFFGALRGNVRSGDLFLRFPEEGYSSDRSALLYFNSRRSVKVVSVAGVANGAAPVVNIRLKVRGALLEYKGDLDLESPGDRKKLETEAAQYVSDICRELIGTMQEAKADAIGIGQHVRNAMAYRDWQRVDWPDAFSRAKINVQVQVQLRNFGKIQ